MLTELEGSTQEVQAEVRGHVDTVTCFHDNHKVSHTGQQEVSCLRHVQNKRQKRVKKSLYCPET